MNTTYAVEKNFTYLNCKELMEPQINHLASTYIAENYPHIVESARKLAGIDQSKVEDLVHDVWVSIATSESEGNGYSISRSNAGDIITVEQFVFGRLKGYAKNKRYSREGCDRHTYKKNIRGESVTFTDFDIAFASADSNDPEQMDGIQRAYFNAHSYDNEIESIESEMSLKDDVTFCLGFNEVVGFDLMNLFKNIDLFNCNIDSNIFDNLREKMKYHCEFGEALCNVLLCAKDHRGIYDSVLATF